ncbi:hypothetical protein [Streptomyces sp. NPDC003247]|uniref:hypothetical protein n=1 Tax=Streptomyces sp. NPDC003247 TaxID=3364677 RepID=UPI0036D0506A
MGWPAALRQLKDLLYEMYLAASAPSLDEITGGIADDDNLGIAGPGHGRPRHHQRVNGRSSRPMWW